MPDLFALADLGRAAVEALALPVAVWTLVALLAEAALRLPASSAALALPVRGAVLASLPLAVLAPLALSALAPQAAVAVAAFAPGVTWLPGVTVGGPAPDVAAAGPDPFYLLAGMTAVAAVLLAVVRLAQVGVAVVRAVRMRDALPVADADTRAAVETARRRLGVARAVAAARAPAGAAPFTLGWRRPVVALPAGLTPEAREVAAVHELAHVRRSDYAWHAAQQAVAATFAAHPLVAVLARGLDLDRERVADAAVLAACPGRRRAYADLLFSYAALPAPPLALGAAGGSSALKSRIDAMASPLSPTRTRRLARTGRLLALTVLALTVAGAAATTPTAAPPSDSIRIVEGRVTDAATGQGIPMANVSVVATLLGAATDLEGRYRIDVPNRDVTLRVSAAGYGVRDVPLQAGVAELDIALSTGSSESPSVGTRPDTTEVYEIVDEMPQLIGGLEGLMARVTYPDLAKRAGIQGRVVVQFVVDAEGRVVTPEAIRSPHEMLARAAIEAVQGSQFTPGRQGGQAVPVRFAVPVTFALPDAADDDRADAGPRPTVGDPEGDPDVMGVVDEMPKLIGGLAGLQARVEYPPLAKDAGIEGRVVVQFIVDEAGAVEDAVVLRSPHDMLSEAALRAVREARFEPGRQRGEPVKVRFAVPVTFRLPAEGDQGDRGEARPASGARLQITGLDQSLVPDPALFRHMLVENGRILRERAPSLPTGSKAEVSFRYDAEGRITGDIEIAVEARPDDADRVFADLSRSFVGLLRRPAPSHAGETVSYTVAYVRG